MNAQNELFTQLLGKIEDLERQLNSAPPPRILTNLQRSENRLLSFTEKEIMKMPKSFRKTFRIQGCTVHVRKRITGRYNRSYEIRYAKKPYNNPPITASGTTLEEAKARFIEKLNDYEPKDDSTPTVPKDFDGFAMYWFENFHKRKVSERTYKESVKLYNRHVKSQFNGMKIDKVTPVSLQDFLDKFEDRPKTKDDLHSQLNQIFTAAVKHGLIKINPLGMVFHRQHEREHGQAISKADENKLLSAYSVTPFQMHFAIALYTGLRPNEYETATIDGEFIKAVNSKRKGGKTAFKRIPITPMLRPYLNGVTELKMATYIMLMKRFKKVLPKHSLYDMRTTFQTRCTECGISDVAIGLFMGNSIGCALKEAYTDVSDEYLLKEGEKLNY